MYYCEDIIALYNLILRLQKGFEFLGFSEAVLGHSAHYKLTA
jgi:hypothetical protein